MDDIYFSKFVRVEEARGWTNQEIIDFFATMDIEVVKLKYNIFSGIMLLETEEPVRITSIYRSLKAKLNGRWCKAVSSTADEFENSRIQEIQLDLQKEIEVSKTK